MLKIAIPQHNEFTRKSIETLRKSGVDFSPNIDKYGSICCSQDFPAQIRMMDFEQIISVVASGAQDIGIVGAHHFENSDTEICCVHSFTSFKSNFSLFINKDLKYKGLESLTGRKIATAFPNLVGAFFKKRNIRVNICQYQPPLPLMVELGNVDGICTLTDDYLQNFCSQLYEIEAIMQSCPIIIANKNLSAQKHIILDELIDRIKSVQNAEGKKMVYVAVPMEKKDSILQFLTQYNYKTVEMAIGSSNRFIIHIMADEKHLWDLKTHLKSLGAENIYVLPIEKII